MTIDTFAPAPLADRPSLPEIVYQGLREAIMNGVFAPRQVLRQDEIARRFGVSRAPLREALPRLEAEGIVVFNARRGYLVAALDVADIREIFRLRALMEQDAAALAAQKRSKEDIKHARTLLDHLKELYPGTPEGSFTEWSACHFEFHRALIEPSGYRRHIKMVDELRTQVESYIRMELSFTGNNTQSDAEHLAMFQAFKAGDGDKLARLIREHCEHTSQRLISGMERRAADAAGVTA